MGSNNQQLDDGDEGMKMNKMNKMNKDVEMYR
jgi:hypothetical protein